MRRALVAIWICAGCTLELNKPHDMDGPPRDLIASDQATPRDGPVASVNLPGCSFSASSRR